MKKSILLLCLLAAACGRTENDGFFEIKGDVKEVKDGTVMSLYKQNKNFWVNAAVDTVVNGNFSFRVPIKENTMFSVNAPFDAPDFSSLGRDIYGAPGEKVKIKGENTLIHTWTVKSKNPEQAVDNRYVMASKNEYDRMQRIMIEEKRIIRNDPDMMAIDIIDSLRQLRSDLKLKILRNDIAIMDKTPVSKAWIERLRSLSIASRDPGEFALLKADAKRLFERLSDEEKENPQGKSIKLALTAPVQTAAEKDRNGEE